MSAAELPAADVLPLAGGACGVTRAFFLMYSGGCRRMAVQRDHAGAWRFCEFPYEPGKPCELPGAHPHRGRLRGTGKILRP